MTAGHSRAEFTPALHHLEEVLRGIRAGRATAGLVENLEVEAYGSRLHLKELATISTPDPRTITVEPWDKAIVPAVERAIATSPLGLNPAVAGAVIRLTLPPLTEERRRELTRLVGQHVEETKISIRHVREKLLRDLRARKETGALSEDALERERKKLQDDVDAATALAEERGREKASDILAG